MTTGPLRFNTVEATTGTPDGSANMVGTGQGEMTINSQGEGVRLSGLTLPSGFPSNGTFRVTGFQIRATVTKGTSIFTGNLGFTVSTSDAATSGTEQQLSFTNSTNEMRSIGGVRDLLGYGTQINTQQALAGLELRIRSFGPPTQCKVVGIRDVSTLFSTFGLSPSIEVFYEMRNSSGDGDDIEALNQIDAATPSVEDVQESFDYNFEGQNHSTSSVTQSAQENASGIIGWNPSNPSGQTDMTGWRRGSQCIDTTNNSEFLWKPLANSETPVLSTTRHCHSWNLHDSGTGSNNTGPYSGHAGGGLHATPRENEFLYTETSSRGDNIHHIVRTPAIKMDEVYTNFTNGDFDEVYLEFYLYAFGPSVGNLYVYHDNSSTSTDGNATLLAKCMHYTGGSFSGTANTSGVTHSHILANTNASSGFTQISTYSYQSYYQTSPNNIPTSAMTSSQSDYDTYWQRIRIPLHGALIGGDTPVTNMMDSTWQGVTANHTQYFYFVYQCSSSTSLVTDSKTEVGNHTATHTTSLSGHSGFFGDLAIDDVRVVGVADAVKYIKKVNDVGAQSTDHIIFDFMNLYDD